MSKLLRKRVEKAKQLRIIPAVNGEKGCFNTYGSKGDHYKICLKSENKNIVTPDGYRPIKVFRTSCQKSEVDLNNPYIEHHEYCKGNTHHTACYHCIGAVWFALKQADLRVSFFETYHDAVNGLNFGGKIAEIMNQNGTGSIWCVYRKEEEEKQEQQFIMLLPEQKVKSQILSVEENRQLMRGSENDEGID